MQSRMAGAAALLPAPGCLAYHVCASLIAVLTCTGSWGDIGEKYASMPIHGGVSCVRSETTCCKLFRFFIGVYV